MRLATGHRLGHYEITGFIGEGGMGQVYRARDLRLRREVAVKVLQTAVDADSWSRFEREAHSASALNHPNVCTVHDLGEADGQPYLVMELVEGVTLRQAIENRTLDSASVVPLAIQIAAALEAAHAKNIIHRDIKPGNVMMTPSGHVKVLDFGLAKVSAEAATGHSATMEPLTAAGAMVGTPQFLAPEILQGRHADAHSDVWAFGVVLYQMASGELPFKGTTAFDVSSAILRDPPPPLPAGVPSGLRRVIDRCLQKAPSSRLLNGYTSDLGTLYKAEEELQQVARDAPDLFSLPATQTLVYLAQGRKELVPAARLAEVGRQYPSHADTAISRFVLLMFADDNASAQALGDDTLRREPLLGPVRGLMAELRRTEGDAAGAIRELQKVLEQAPSNISAITFLARAYIDNGEADKARDLLEANRKAFADNYAWRHAWASVLAAEGQREQALIAMDETTLKLASALLPWTLPTAETYARLGDTERALDWIERAVRNGDERTSWLRRSPAFAKVRETPAFARIVDSVEARRRR